MLLLGTEISYFPVLGKPTITGATSPPRSLILSNFFLGLLDIKTGAPIQYRVCRKSGFSLRSLYFSLLNMLRLTVPYGCQHSSKPTQPIITGKSLCVQTCVSGFSKTSQNSGQTVNGGWIRVPWEAENTKKRFRSGKESGEPLAALCHGREGAADWKELPQ